MCLRFSTIPLLLLLLLLQDVEVMKLLSALGAAMQSAGLRATAIPSAGSSSVLLFYGHRILQRHTVTTMNTLAAQFGREPPAWLQQLLLQGCKDTAGSLALVHLQQQQHQDAVAPGAAWNQTGESQAPAQMGSQTAADKRDSFEEDAVFEVVVADSADLQVTVSLSRLQAGSVQLGLDRLLYTLRWKCAVAAAAVKGYHAKQQQKQQQAYKQVLERVYAAAAATPAATIADTTTSSSSSSSDRQQSLTDLLLSRLTVSPTEGQTDSFDCLTDAWSDWSNGPALKFDHILGPGAKPTGVQRWLLPQLLDDAQPPLFVVAPAGTGRMTAVLLAAAAELAAAVAEEQAEDAATEAVDAAAAAVVEGDSDAEGEEVDVEVEGKGDGEDETTADTVLPWEEVEAAAAADDADNAAGDVFGYETAEGIQQQQQQEKNEEEEDAAATAAAAAEDSDAADEGQYDDAQFAEPVCFPFLLLTLPTQSAAEAAAAQHGPVMAAAGVRLALLPTAPTVAQSVDEAAASAVVVAERELERLQSVRRTAEQGRGSGSEKERRFLRQQVSLVLLRCL
jgi:hypothetical protein